MKDSNRDIAIILILFVALISGIVIFGTRDNDQQADSFILTLSKAGYTLKTLDISNPINCTNLSQSQFLDKCRELNATTVYFQYYTFYVFTSDLTNGYTY